MQFTVTAQSFGVDAAATGVFEYSVDGGGYTTKDMSAGSGKTIVWLANFGSPPATGSHTVTLRVVSGTVTINRFIVI